MKGTTGTTTTAPRSISISDLVRATGGKKKDGDDYVYTKDGKPLVPNEYMPVDGK